MPVMDKQWLNDVAWIGDEWVKGPIRGVVLSFHGLGSTARKTDPTTVELGWAKAGGLVVFPYYGPWSWMNRQARTFVDELVDTVYAVYGLSDNTPLLSTGGSMGGHSALLYARYARRPITACLALYLRATCGSTTASGLICRRRSSMRFSATPRIGTRSWRSTRPCARWPTSQTSPTS